MKEVVGLFQATSSVTMARMRQTNRQRANRPARAVFLCVAFGVAHSPQGRAEDSPSPAEPGVSCPIAVGFSLTNVDSLVPFDSIAGGETAVGEVDVSVVEGETGAIHVYPSVISALGAGGVQGFALGIQIDGEAICGAATIHGTAWGADESRSSNFQLVECIDPAMNGGRRGVVGAIVLSFVSFEPLPPVGTFSLLDLTLEADGKQGQARKNAQLRFQDGLRGRGRPVQNQLTVEGSSVVPCNLDQALLEVSFHPRPESPFIRGDANHDGRLDVSDPVTLLRYEFYGDVELRCPDAADVSDDGKLGIVDAILSFGYLFLGYREPPAPFPEPGEDPTQDELRCP